MIEIVCLIVSIINLLVLLAIFGEVMDIRDYVYFKELFSDESSVQDD